MRTTYVWPDLLPAWLTQLQEHTATNLRKLENRLGHIIEVSRTAESTSFSHGGDFSEVPVWHRQPPPSMMTCHRGPGRGKVRPAPGRNSIWSCALHPAAG